MPHQPAIIFWILEALKLQWPCSRFLLSFSLVQLSNMISLSRFERKVGWCLFFVYKLITVREVWVGHTKPINNRYTRSFGVLNYNILLYYKGYLFVGYTNYIYNDSWYTLGCPPSQ